MIAGVNVNTPVAVLKSSRKFSGSILYVKVSSSLKYILVGSVYGSSTVATGSFGIGNTCGGVLTRTTTSVLVLALDY